MTDTAKGLTRSQQEKRILISEEQDGMMIWLGSNGHIRKSAGQVFYNGHDALLESVAVIPQAIMTDARLKMQLFEFDLEGKQWKTKIAEAEQQVLHSHCEEWMFFPFEHQVLNPGKWYGFKMSCTHGHVALAEGIHRSKGNEQHSMQWTSDSVQEPGNFHADFHLAYLVELAA